MISERGLQLIREFEGLRLKAYPDPASGGDPWTIGYGRAHGVAEGDTCTQEQAEQWLRQDAEDASRAVLRHVVPMLTQNQLDALTSFVFNLGEGNFAGSSLLRKINAHDFDGAAREFGRWNHAAGKEFAGLTRRREQEAALFTLEKPMIPFIAAAIPALIEAAPALIRIFGDSPQAEKNAKAAETVADLAKKVTGETTAEGAVNAIQADPAKAAQFREEVHQSMGELMGYLAQASEIDEKSRDSALDRNVTLAKESGGRWLWLLGGVALLVVVMSYVITAGVLFWNGTTFSDETKALLLGQVVIFGFMTVLAFLFGSNIQNRISQNK
jgi:lysozyme